MKKDLHPNYIDTTVKCACGKTWIVNSTTKDAHIGICSACHPFYTGQQKFVDTEGRVERFQRRWAKK